MLILDDSTPKDILFPKDCGRGAIPRDLSIQPLPMEAVQLPTIPRSEWSARIKEKIETKSRITDVLRRAGWKRAIQWMYGYCWFNSATNALTAARVLRGLPHKQLSGFYGAMLIKNFQNQGGWSPLAYEFLEKNGTCEATLFPEDKRDPRYNDPRVWQKYNTPEAKANAALYKVTEGWVDLGRNIWERNLTFDQVATLALSNIPFTLDLDWWGHSIAGFDLVEIESGSFGINIGNSWDGWGDDLGCGVLREQKATPNAAVAIRDLTIAV